MNINKITLTILILILALVGVVLYKIQNGNNTFGSSGVPYFYSYFDATNTSSSAPTVATTGAPILSLDANRNNAHICNTSRFDVYLFPKSISTTTGVLTSAGIPLSPAGLATSTPNICQDFPGFKGYLFGLAPNGTSTLTVSSYR